MAGAVGALPVAFCRDPRGVVAEGAVASLGHPVDRVVGGKGLALQAERAPKEAVQALAVGDPVLCNGGDEWRGVVSLCGPHCRREPLSKGVDVPLIDPLLSHAHVSRVRLHEKAAAPAVSEAGCRARMKGKPSRRCTSPSVPRGRARPPTRAYRAAPSPCKHGRRWFRGT